MRRILFLAAMVGSGAIAAPAAAQTDDLNPVVDPTPYTCDEQTSEFHIKRAKRVILRGFDHSRWRKEDPWTRGHQRRMAQHRNCLIGEEMRRYRRGIARFKASKARSFDRYRERQLAKRDDASGWCAPPELQDPAGAGCWVIPFSIVSCESGGGDWGAANPSGAVGPYQLLGWGAPFPVTSRAAAMVHHRIAARLWAGGSGASHWEQCL